MTSFFYKMEAKTRLTDDQLCQQIMDGISQYNANKKSTYKGKRVILLIGPTGVGKSTLIELCKSKPLNIQKVTFKYDTGEETQKIVIDCAGSNIGHTFESTTQEPLEHTITGYIFLDCPGFDDSGGPVPEIIHSYQLFQIVKEVNQVKIVIVASEAEMTGAKSKVIIETIKRTKKLIFGDSDQQTNQFGLVITKCSNKKTFAQLGYSPKIINQFDQNNIFLFPKPPKNFSGQYPIEKTGLSNLRSFINNETTFITVSNPSVSLNDESMRLLEKVSNKQIQKNTDLLKKLSELILRAHEELSDNCFGQIEKLNHAISIIKNRLEKMKSLKKTCYFIEDSEDFANKFSSTLDYDEDDIKNTLNSIAQTKEFSNFLKIILNKDIIIEDFQNSVFDFYGDVFKDLKNQIRLLEAKLWNASKNQFLIDFQKQLPLPETQVLLKEFNDHFNLFKENCATLNLDHDKKEQLLKEFEKDAHSIYDTRVVLYDSYDKELWEENKNSFLSEFDVQFSNMDEKKSKLEDFNFYFNQVKQNQEDFNTFVVIIPGWKDKNGQKFTKREKFLLEQALKSYESEVSKHKLAKNEWWQDFKDQLITDFQSVLPKPDKITSLKSLDDINVYINKVKEMHSSVKLDQDQEKVFRKEAENIYQLYKKDISFVEKERWGIDKTKFLIDFETEIDGLDFSKHSFDEIFNKVKSSNSNISMDSYQESQVRNEANLIFLDSQRKFNNRKEEEKLNQEKIKRMQEERKNQRVCEEYKRKYKTLWGFKEDNYKKFTHFWREIWKKTKDGNGNIISDEFFEKIEDSDEFYYTDTYEKIKDDHLVDFFQDYKRADSRSYPRRIDGKITGHFKVEPFE